MKLSGNRLLLLLCFKACVLALPATLIAQSTAFIGEWRAPDWKPRARNVGIVLTIVQSEAGLAGTVHFYDPRSEHRSIMRNPRVSGKTFAFDVDDEYVKSKLSFSMILKKGGKIAVVKGSGKEIFLELKLMKQP